MTLSLVEIFAAGLKEALSYIDTLEARLSDDSGVHMQLAQAKNLLAEKDKTIADLTNQVKEATEQVDSLTTQFNAQSVLLQSDESQLQQLVGLTDLITKLQAKVGTTTNPITPTTPVINVPSDSTTASDDAATLPDAAHAVAPGGGSDAGLSASADSNSPASTVSLDVATAANSDPVQPAATGTAESTRDTSTADGGTAASDAVAAPTPLGAV